MFASLLRGELKKAFNVKTAIVFAVIFVIGMAVITPVFMLLDYSAEEDYWDESDVYYYPDTYTEESVNQELGALKSQLEALKVEKEKLGYDYYRSGTDMIFYVEARIAELEFIRDNALYDTPLATYSGGVGVTGGGETRLTADAFINTAFQLFFLMLWIYALVVSSSVFADEYKNRTLKLLFLRPVTRNQVTTAKLLATLIVVTSAYAVAGLTIIAVGCCAFDVAHVQTVFSFNGGAFTVQDRTASIPITFALYYIPVLTMAILGFTLSTLTRKRTLGIVLPIVADVLSEILTVSGLGRFFIIDAMDFVQFAGLSDSVTAGGNAFISLAVFAVYTAVLIAASYLSVRKRDIA